MRLAREATTGKLTVCHWLYISQSVQYISDPLASERERPEEVIASQLQYIPLCYKYLTAIAMAKLSMLHHATSIHIINASKCYINLHR